MLVEVIFVYKIVKKSTPGFTHVEEVKKNHKTKTAAMAKNKFLLNEDNKKNVSPILCLVSDSLLL